MKRLLLIPFFVCGCSLLTAFAGTADTGTADTGTASAGPAKRIVADKVLAIIYHPEETKLICQSDLQADLTERVPMLKDVVMKELIVLDGKKLKIPVSEADVDKALGRVQEHLKMTRDELTDFFKQQGYTLEQAKKELEKNILVENVMEARVRSKAHVPQKDIEMYCKENPLELYELQQSFVPFSGGSKALERAVVERDIESDAIASTVSWHEVGVIQGRDFSPEKAYIKELPEGSVTIVNESDEGISLLRLVSKKVVSLEERKNEIAGMLGKERFLKAQENYYTKLRDDASVRYLDKAN